MDDQWSRIDQPAQPAGIVAVAMRALRKSTTAPYTTANAFRQLYERTHLSVYRFVYALHGGPAEDVEDIAAETWERAWNGRMRFRGNEHDAVGWLLTIARNLVIDKQRAEQRRPSAMALDGLAFEPPAEGHV